MYEGTGSMGSVRPRFRCPVHHQTMISRFQPGALKQPGDTASALTQRLPCSLNTSWKIAFSCYAVVKKAAIFALNRG